MRTGMLFLLLGSVAAPALAVTGTDDRSARREAARAERAEARSERQAERAPQRSERPAEVRSVEPRAAPERSIIVDRRPVIVERRALERGSPAPAETGSGRPALDQRRVLESRVPRTVEIDAVRPQGERRGAATDRRVEVHRGPRIVEVDSGTPAESVREWRRSEREQMRAQRPAVIEQRTADGWQSLRERRRETTGRDAIGNRRVPVVSRVPREGTQPPPPAAAKPASLSTRHWRGDWRSDRRYDWHNHRKRNRWLFRLGFYFDPFGWSYRPFSIGWRMWPSYYRSSYWLTDPWMYRLPPAYPPYRWIRYYDDALLIDTWSGEVVDVIHDFFW